MKLSEELIEKLSTKNKMMLAIELEVSKETIDRWIRENSENLTTIKSIKKLEEITGLTQDQMFQFNLPETQSAK